eukprot:scaffold56827_cov52-Attheya_sp.AAC.2
MVGYGLMMLPLIKQLKREHPNVSQPWYADDARAGGKFTAIRNMFERLQELGPARGYFPEPSKSILVITTGNRYLGGFVGEAAPQEEEWVRGKTDAWATAVTTLAKVCKRYQQLAYAGLQKSFQQEWQFLQRVTDGISTELESVESSLKNDFLSALLGQSKIGQPLRDLLALPVKHAGIAIPNPTTSAGGGLVISRHDEIKDELGQLAGKALKPSAIRDEPLINNGRKVECSSDAPTEADLSTTPPSPVIRDNDNQGDLMIRGFWSRGTDCIVDVRITDLDSKSYQKKRNDKVLAGQEQEKK